MNTLRFLLVLCFTLYVTSVEACRYTIREIGFSTLSKVTYVIYRIDENSTTFPRQLELSFSDSNVKPYALNLNQDANNPIVSFAKNENLAFPVYVLVDKNQRMLAMTESDYQNNLKSSILSSPVQNQLLKNLPLSYASVLLIEGINADENRKAKEIIQGACNHITNIMPNMPKQVDVGPDMITISQDQFQKERVLLWSLGVEGNLEKPTAFVMYGKGRIMGELINYESIVSGDVFKLLSIIGADCECGLDRKWLFGYQVPLNWPKQTRQNLSDRLGFDVDNPMVLTEMSRILAIENREPQDPDGITYEPIVVNLDEEFDDIPEIVHNTQPEESLAQEDDQSNNIIWYSLAVFVILIGVGVVFILKKKS